MYYLAIVLPDDLNDRVAHWKNFMHLKYQCKVGLKSPAHITLIPPFWMEEAKEHLLLDSVASVAATLSPFTIRTANFSAFKPRTIFIDVANSEALNNTKVAVDNFFKQISSLPVKIDVRPFHPHITIATRDLFKKSFLEVWPKFEKEKFEAEWEADGISVVRHNKKNWDVIHTSQFQKI